MLQRLPKGNWKIQTKMVEHAIGTAAATLDTLVTLNRDYEKVVGVMINEITDGDEAYYRVGLESDSGSIYSELVHKNALECQKGQPQDQKWAPIAFDIEEGYDLKIRTNFPSQIATDALKFEVAFLLYREENPNQ